MAPLTFTEFSYHHPKRMSQHHGPLNGPDRWVSIFVPRRATCALADPVAMLAKIAESA